MFDKAALTWQQSIGLELAAGLVGILFSLFARTMQLSVIGAMLVIALLVVAYFLRYSAHSTYDDAETMRRQAVLGEGLGWPLGRAELLDWRNRAGAEILALAQKTPRPDDYYDNNLGEGAKKLAEMTFESAYWTRCIYRHMRKYLVIALTIAGVLAFALIGVALSDFVPAEAKTLLAYAAFLLAPVVLTLDFLGMTLKLQRAIKELKDLMVHLENVAKEAAPTEAAIMRLVSEYNCIVSAGVPMPSWIWKRHGDAIGKSWKLAWR